MCKGKIVNNIANQSLKDKMAIKNRLINQKDELVAEKNVFNRLKLEGKSITGIMRLLRNLEFSRFYYFPILIPKVVDINTAVKII